MFEVIVGNIRTVYSGRSYIEANRHWGEYIQQSKSERGRAGGESVTMMIDGEIVREYIGTIDQRESS